MTKGPFAMCLLGVTTLMLVHLSIWAGGDTMDSYRIGGHGQADIKYPAWFKESLLDLQEDLNDARSAGKRGVIVFLSQKQCSHCQAFLDTTLNDPVTRERVQRNYDVIGLDIFNDLEVTDIDGSVSSIKAFAEAQRARFTPTLLFYGTENARLLKIVGFYPPEKFNRALDYIDGGHYQRETLAQYLRRGDGKAGSTKQVMVFDYTMFAEPPHVLDRATVPGMRPLLVLFERPACSPCRRFHGRVLSDPEVRALITRFDAVQLDATDNNTKLTVPDGREMTPHEWAKGLQLTYDMSVVFFDEQGKEVHRSDAETGKDRMAGSMRYVLEKAYVRYEQFLRWRRENALNEQKGN